MPSTYGIIQFQLVCGNTFDLGLPDSSPSLLHPGPCNRKSEPNQDPLLKRPADIDIFCQSYKILHRFRNIGLVP